MTAVAFATLAEENIECVIIVATDAYGMGINNPDVKLVIQWDIPMTFDSMIQRMGRAGRKGGQSTFVLFTPKWSAIKDQKEIKERKAKKSNTVKPNKSIQPASPLCQVPNASAEEDEESDNESVAGSTAGSVADSEAKTFDMEDADLFGKLIITDADENQQKRKKQRQSSKTDAQKRARLPNEIFDYIHVAGCRRLFSLAWYGDTTYANIDRNPLPSSCCNGSTCKSQELDYL